MYFIDLMTALQQIQRRRKYWMEGSAQSDGQQWNHKLLINCFVMSGREGTRKINNSHKLSNKNIHICIYRFYFIYSLNLDNITK